MTSATAGDVEPVIDLRGITKRFGAHVALRDLDLTVTAGQIHGLLGPNGAGKSVTLRLVLGLLRASSGSARVMGRDPWRDSVELHRRLAYVPGDVALWPTMTGGEVIDFLTALRGGVDPRRRDELVEVFRLDPTRRCRQYSRGNRQKVALIAALSADVELLVLDEPTTGLDPLMEHAFQQEIRDAQDRGATVVLSSHILAEVDSLADHVSIIKDGTVISSGPLVELRRSTRTRVRATLVTEPPERLTRMLEPIHVATGPDGHDIDGSVDSARIGDLMSALVDCGVRSLTVEPPTLESMFLDIYSGEPGLATR